MMDVAGIRAVTFDCYGTLIDWESGILRAIMPLLASHGARPAEADVLRAYADAEARVEAGPYLPYREVLAQVLDHVAAHAGVHLRPEERTRLAESVRDWPAFHDTPAALRALRDSGLTLCICSNIDDDLFEGSVPHLGLRPDRLVTAAFCRSYKPDPRHFQVALELLGLRPDQVLHVAQSKYHDIAPAAAMGFRTAWINRASRLKDVGVAPRSEARADITAPDLATLVAALPAR